MIIQVDLQHSNMVCQLLSMSSGLPPLPPDSDTAPHLRAISITPPHYLHIAVITGVALEGRYWCTARSSDPASRWAKFGYRRPPEHQHWPLSDESDSDGGRTNVCCNVTHLRKQHAVLVRLLKCQGHCGCGQRVLRSE